MAVAAGTKLGPYEVLSPLGAGGMGEVYRARDSRLGREVAVKVLPAGYSNDPELLRRFEQEARATAALNHPNILALFDIARQDESPYIVSELLEGETLRGRLRGGALPVKTVIDYALQILRGLVAAHDRGIFHRDLKPENIFVTRTGQIKILDFGLAKLTMPESESIDTLSAGLTTEAATGRGAILGTMGYMSPEQLRGQPSDARGDLFSFGVVLFEMLSGQRPFRGETIADTISAVLREDPPEFVATGRDVPPILERIVRHCLEKDPAARFQSARDVEFGLESLSISSSSSPFPVTSARSPKTWLIAAALGLVVAGFATWVMLTRSRQTVQNPLSNAQFTPLTNLEGSETDPAISPDGKFVAFISDRSGTFDIWLIQANGSSLANLTGGRMGDARGPLRAIGFSGDGSEVWSAGTPDKRLMLWPLIGGAPHNFLDEHAAEVAWSPMAPGWSITAGNRATRYLSLITTAPTHARLCKTSLDCTTTIPSGRRMGAGYTWCAADQRRVKWTCGAFRRTGEHPEQLTRSQHRCCLPSPDQRPDDSVCGRQRRRGRTMVVGVRYGDPNFTPCEFRIGTIRRSGSHQRWQAPRRECRKP